MDENTLNDLKQFIAATVSQATANMATKDDIARLEKKVDDGFAGVGDAIEDINKRIDEQYKEVDQRITRLEQQST
jgi:hypothetical protein